MVAEKFVYYKSFVIWYRHTPPTNPNHITYSKLTGLQDVGVWYCSWKNYQHTWSAIRYGMPHHLRKNGTFDWYVQDIMTGEVTASSKDNEKKN